MIAFQKLTGLQKYHARTHRMRRNYLQLRSLCFNIIVWDEAVQFDPVAKNHLVIHECTKRSPERRLEGVTAEHPW